MLKREIEAILSGSNSQGWVPEPEAKRLLSLAGLPVPRYLWSRSLEDALRFTGEIGYPVVAKVVSFDVVHKSDQGGVVVGIAGPEELAAVFDRFRQFGGFDGVLVEEMLTGLELIIGAKVDYQFGPVVLLGMGGVRAEIYRDIALRMAPLDDACIRGMVKSLRAHRLLEGYRGGDPINLQELSRLMTIFSSLVMEMEDLIDSIDLNPVMCTKEKCIIADARIMLQTSRSEGQDRRGESGIRPGG